MTPPDTRTRPHLNNPAHTAIPAPVGVGSTAARGDDNNGNRTGQTTGGTATAYSYDPANRLVGVSGTTSIGYTYDGDGYRVGATIDPTDPTAYTWDRLGLGGLGQIIADDTGENVFGPAGMQQRVSSGTAQYAHGDGLGSLRLVTDANGAAAGSATYEPWGAPRSGSATLGGYGYTGELTDAETGFVYLRARYLDPATGRFTTPDPLGLGGGSTNFYAYAGDNPARYVDPSGLIPWKPIVGCAVGGTVAAIGGAVIGAGAGPAGAGWGAYAGSIVGCAAGTAVGIWAEGNSGGGSSSGSPTPTATASQGAFCGPTPCRIPGPGQWQAVNEAMSDDSAAYQEQITGVRARWYAYVVNGTKFDGYDCDRGVLLDAKGKYKQFFESDGRPKDFYVNSGGFQQLLDEAQRQVRAANGVPIEWRVSEQEGANAIAQAFAANGIAGIQIIWTPYDGRAPIR